MGLTGDWADLARFISKLERVGEAKAEILEGLGEHIVDLIKQGHESGTAPDGSTWAAKVDGEASHLEGPSGDLKSSWHTKSVDSDSVTVGPGPFYAAVHQGGKTIHARGKGNKRRESYTTRKGKQRTRTLAKGADLLTFKVGDRWVSKESVTIPARPMVPDGSLPPRWEAELERAAVEMLREYLTD